MAKRTTFGELKEGDWLSEVQYYRVREVRKDAASLTNERGFKISVGKDVIEEGMFSASQFSKEETVPRTKLVEVLEGAQDTIFSVNFQKQAKEKEVANKVLEVVREKFAEGDQKALEKELKRAVKDSIQGAERTLVGYLIQVEPKMGRSQVIDLEAPEKSHRLRLVDHRSINWIILKNTKYTAK